MSDRQSKPAAAVVMTPRERLWAAQAHYAPYFFVAPFVLLFCCFLVYPLGRSLVISLNKTGAQDMQFVGFRNYAYLLGDLFFWRATLNTIGYTAAFVFLQIPAALGLAMLLNSAKVRGRNVFRFAFFVPHLVGGVFVAVIFGLLLSNNGPVNSAIRTAFAPHAELRWLGDPYLARAAVVLAYLWLNVGFGMIYFLAALQAVDKELYEAADVDGAGRWSQFWHVTIPGIRPVLSFMILTGTIGGLQLFELPYVLFNGAGPGGAGVTIVAYLFGYIEINDFGTAAAIGWILAAAIIGIATVQVRVMGGKSKEI